MFKRIRVRLVVWNALMFFFILVLFGGTILIDLRFRLIGSLDRETLSRTQPVVRAIQSGEMPPMLLFGGGRDFGEATPFQRMPLALILWDQAGDPITVLPQDIHSAAEAQLRNLATADKSGFVDVNGQQVRVMNIPITSISGIAGKYDLEVLRNSQTVADTMQQSLIVVVIGVLIGAVLAILAGFLLAGRALVPIRRAWDKQVQFVADASHEIRTPLAAISANSELLLREPSATVESKAPVVSGILGEARRMNRLVTHLLTLARSDSHLSQLERKPIDIGHLTSQVTEQFKPLCEVKAIRLQTDLSPDVVISVDEERIRQLLFILLDNALKFTEEEGEIRVSSRRNGRKVELSVTDTGCGIPEDIQPHIFDRFFRADKSRQSESQSAGLGLSIAKWIVDAHDGSMRVHSVVGEGTTMTVVLPQK